MNNTDIEHKVSEDYWVKKTTSLKPKTSLPKGDSDIETIEIPRNSLDYLYNLSHGESTAMFTIILAVYSGVLSRYVDYTDNLRLSCDFLGENTKNTNSVFYSIALKDCPKFVDHLHKVKKEIQDVFRYCNYNSSKLKERLGTSYLKDFTSYSLSFNSKKDNCFNSKIHLDCYTKNDQTVKIELTYHSGYFSAYLASHILVNIKTWLINLKTYMNIPVMSIAVLSKKETSLILNNFNTIKLNYSINKTIVDVFKEQVQKTPNSIAIVFQGKVLCYDELDKISNQFACYLKETYTIVQDDLIGLKIAKSDLMMIAILGILKSGGAYVPIDINLPEARIEFIKSDCNSKVVIEENEISQFMIDKSKYSDTIITLSKPNDLAYVMYTSGTTGVPKGVLIEHRSVVRLVKPCLCLDLNEKNTLLSTGSISFDATIFEFFGTLLNGAKLILLDQEDLLHLDRFKRNIERYQVDSLWMTSSWFNQVVDEKPSVFETIHKLVVGGDTVSPFHVSRIQEKYPKLLITNGYGPTENTTFSTIFRIKKQQYNTIPIGKPIANSSAYILNDVLEPVPIGVAGKLYVSGAGVARGYLNRPKLTAEKFIPNPFIEGTYMYDTGDLAKWSPDGNILFLGRKDTQVKLRGYRIELGEIENLIIQYSKDITQVIVTIKDVNKSKSLVVYYSAKEKIEHNELRKYLKKKLPDYMVPNFYVEVEKFSLTHNGKIDRKALANIRNKDIFKKEYKAPKNKTEKILVAIWQHVLGVKQIGITDNFFELGGHSLMISQVINKVQEQLDKLISFKDFYEQPTIESLCKKLQSVHYVPIEKALEADSYPLTSSQNRFWVMSQLDGGTLAYNISSAIKIKGDIQVDKFKKSFSKLICDYEILRTYFKANSKGEVRQYIIPNAKISFNIEEIDYSSEKNKKVLVDAYLQEKSGSSFNLTQVPLIKGSLLKLEQGEFVFFLSLHHIIADGWSIEILISEIIKNYNNLVENKGIKASKLKIQYKDYAVWINKSLQKEKQQYLKQYWLQQLKGELPVLNLPSFKQRPAIKTYNGTQVLHPFSSTFLKNLKTFSNSQGATLFITLVSGINILLHKYTSQEDIIIGTPIAGRNHPDLENQLGLFLNTLPIRTHLEGHYTFQDIIKNQIKVVLEAYEHQDYPFDELVTNLNFKRDLSRSFLFDVLVVLQNQEQLNNLYDETSFVDFEIFEYRFKKQTSQFDMSFIFSETRGLELTIAYNTAIFDKVFVEKIGAHFENILSQAIRQPDISIAKLNFLKEAETLQLISGFNNTDLSYNQSETIIDLFEIQVKETPDSVAIVYEEKEITYRELNEKSNQLAHYIRKNYQIKKNDLVGIKLERNEQLIVAILGTLKSGAGYVPVDVEYPENRIKYIEDDSKVKMSLDGNELGQFEKVKSEYSKENLCKINDPNSLAYIIYTSGTTGIPKGIPIEHKNTVALINWAKEEFKEANFNIVYASTSHCFDLSIFEMFYTLSIGKKIRLLDNALEIGTYLLKDNKILLNTVPSTMRHILDEGHSLKNVSTINMAGEVFPLDLAQKLLLHKIELRNLYGPSESTTYSTCYKISKTKTYNFIPIGKPIANTQVYVLDPFMSLVPIGVTGQLFIAGKGIAKAYLNKPKLTKAKFVNNPFVEGGCMYDTGDLARWLPDGTLDFLGRTDEQVKLRGYRIEIGEIEHALLLQRDVKQVVVVLKEQHISAVLVAYIVSDSGLNIKNLRTNIGKILPGYMQPNHYIVLDEIPLTINGKIDKKALLQGTTVNFQKKEYVAPNTALEQKIVAIWEDVLKQEQIGITDNFFELGGHSLIITQIVNRFQQEIGKNISYNKFYTNPTIEKLSHILVDKKFSPIEKVAELDCYPTTPSQRRLWFLSQFEEGTQAYHIEGAVVLEGALHVNAFGKAFNDVINRHEIIRTYFINSDDGDLLQYVVPIHDFNLTLDIKDFSNSIAPEEAIKSYIEDIQSKSYVLSKAPLLRAVLIKRSRTSYVFFLSMHHIISDGWSIEILTSEIIKSYKRLRFGEILKLPELAIQFKDYAVWLMSTNTNDTQKESKKYWLDVFQGDIPVLELPSLKERPRIKTYSGQTMKHTYSEHFSSKLTEFSQRQQVTLFTTLMSGVKVLLSRYSNQKDIIVGTPVAGRAHVDLESQIGLYVNTLAIRTQFDEEDSFLEALQKEKFQLLRAYSHQDYPFDSLVEKLNLKRDTSRSPLFDVLVVLHNQRHLSGFHDSMGIPDLEVRAFPVNSTSAQFDLSFAFEEINGLSLNISYNTDIYESSFINNIFYHLENLFSQIIVNPNRLIEAIDLTTLAEKNLILRTFNKTELAFDINKTVMDLLEDQAIRAPSSIALEFGGAALTYQELNEQSNQLARYLLETKRVLPNDFVGIKMERNEMLLISLLSVLKIGAAYVPIDINYPKERIAYIEKDSNCKFIINTNEIFLFQKNKNTYSKENINRKEKSLKTAYVIYTSGTTGQPKGVMITHQNVIALINWAKAEYKDTDFSVVYATTSHCFDLSIFEMFYTLSIGKKIKLLNSALEIGEHLESDTGILINTVPSSIRSILEEGYDLSNVSAINIAGEVFPVDIAKKLLVYNAEIRNLYGPTEDTTYSTCYKLSKTKKYRSIPIGKPIANTEAYILDEYMQLLPIGVPGNLYVAGQGVAQGYLNKSSLTKEKFSKNPFVEGSRMYNTGDLAKWLPDGTIVFLGRTDNQVKINGYRVELEEINEIVKSFSEDITQVLTIIKKVKEIEILVLYFEEVKAISKKELQEYLLDKLPYYMVPRYFIVIPNIPLTANGKIDYKALPEPENIARQTISSPYMAPSNGFEEELVLIWKNILELEEVGVMDCFFELGGHSLKITRLTNEIYKMFNVKIPISTLFHTSILKDQSQIIQNILKPQETLLSSDDDNIEVDNFSI